MKRYFDNWLHLNQKIKIGFYLACPEWSFSRNINSGKWTVIIRCLNVKGILHNIGVLETATKDDKITEFKKASLQDKQDQCQ